MVRRVSRMLDRRPMLSRDFGRLSSSISFFRFFLRMVLRALFFHLLAINARFTVLLKLSAVLTRITG